MAEVPREAVEFARRLVRAFYPDEFVVLLDAVLRQNNFVSHRDLAYRLRMQPKEMRQVLVRMEHARLMRRDKREQKRITIRDGKKQTRVIQTDYWYVPLLEMVDAFMYRVWRITKELEEKRNNVAEGQKYVCTRCGARFQLLDILAGERADGQFECTNMNSKALPCKGLIREQDNSAQIREMERLRNLIDEQLRTLRERADHCSRLDIPRHPLEGADEKTWGERVPETVGARGERVDEDGIDMELKAEEEERKKGSDVIVVEPIHRQHKDDAFIPEKPSWFKEGGGEEEEEWDDTEQHVLDNKAGTAASFGREEDEKAYYDMYVKQIYGAGAEAKHVEDGGNATADEVIDLDADDEVVAVEPGKETEANVTGKAGADTQQKEDVMVSVAGKVMKLSEVTPEMAEQMTPDEYKAYFAVAQPNSTMDDEDDFDEFE
ncbi:Transcription factor E [Gracilaria domingensis]|nr:Transcription factor E [Gracilaria domingensis]